MEKNSNLTKELGEKANDLAKVSLGGIATAGSIVLASIIGSVFRLWPKEKKFNI